MPTTQTLGAVLVGLIAGAWLGRAALKWIAGLDGTPLTIGLVVCALAGAIIAVAAAREDHPARS